MWMFGYNGQRQSLSKSRFSGTAFEVFVYMHAGNCSCVDTPAAPQQNVDGTFGDDLDGDGYGDVEYDPTTEYSRSQHQPPKDDPKLLLRLPESLATEWNTYSDRISVGRFLHKAVKTMGSGKGRMAFFSLSSGPVLAKADFSCAASW